MESYGITMKGRFIIEKLDSLPTFDADRDKGRLVYDLSKYQCFWGSDTQWISVSPDYYTMNDHENRITTNESDISDINTTLSDHDSRITTNNNNEDNTNTTLNDHIDSRDEHPTVTPTENGFMGSSDKDKLDGIDESPIPVGGIVPWPDSTPPTGFLECDGSYVSKTSYSDLYSIIGTNFGGGTNSFKIPDLRGEFVRMAYASSYVGNYQMQRLKRHRHEYRDRYYMESHTKGRAVDGFEYHPGGPYVGSGDTDYDNHYTPYKFTYTSGYGDLETRPRNIALMYIIKY